MAADGVGSTVEPELVAAESVSAASVVMSDICKNN